MGAGTAHSSVLCERMVVLGKKDLVGQWGIMASRFKAYFLDPSLNFLP